MSSFAMDCESSSVEPVCADEFSFEATAVCDSAGSDSSEFVDDVTYDCDCPVYNAECSVVASAGYDWSESFDESANEVDDCPDNLISDVDFDDHESRDSFSLALGSFNDGITVNCPESSDLGPQQSNEVAVQEVTDRIDREHDTLEEDEISISSENRADFAACEFEDFEIESSSDLVFSLEQLSRIKAWTDEVRKEEEKLVQVSELKCIEMQSVSDVVFTFEQQLRFNKWSDEMEKEAYERSHAIFLAEHELSITQYTGYGVYHANQVTPQEIQGLEPKVTGNYQIWDWMSNESNHFEITFYADILLSEK